MNANTTGKNGRHIPWWRKLLRSAGAASVAAAAAAPSAAPAQHAGYRSAAAAPVAWQAFAKELQGQLQVRLSGDDGGAQHLQDVIATHGRLSSRTFVARTWIAWDGRVERIEFDGLSETDIAATLRGLLTGVVVSPPPPDMLQPLQLRLALNANNNAQREQ